MPDHPLIDKYVVRRYYFRSVKIITITIIRKLDASPTPDYSVNIDLVTGM